MFQLIEFSHGIEEGIAISVSYEVVHFERNSERQIISVKITRQHVGQVIA